MFSRLVSGTRGSHNSMQLADSGEDKHLAGGCFSLLPRKRNEHLATSLLRVSGLRESKHNGRHTSDCFLYVQSRGHFFFLTFMRSIQCLNKESLTHRSVDKILGGVHEHAEITRRLLFHTPIYKNFLCIFKYFHKRLFAEWSEPLL